MKGSVHQSRSCTAMRTRKIPNNFLSERDDISTKVIAAEVRFAAFLFEHNLPTAAADHSRIANVPEVTLRTYNFICK